MKYFNTKLFWGVFVVWAFATFIFSCNREACSVENGYVALSDTTLDCRCGSIAMKALDTLHLKKNQCTVLRFQPRILSNWLDSHEVIRVGMEPDAPPAFFTEGAKETGFDYELLKAIFPKVFPGIAMQVKGYSYDTLPQLLLQPNPEIEIIAGGYVQDPSLSGIIWTKPYLTYGYSLITTEANENIFNSLASLSGKKVGIYDDGVTEEWVKKNIPDIGVVIKAVDNTETPYSDWMQMLADGKVDAIIYDYPFAVQEVNDYDDVLVISNKRLNAPDDLMGYSFGIPAGNTRFLKQINEAIEEYKKTSEYNQMVAQFIPDPDKGMYVKAAKEEPESPPAVVAVKQPGKGTPSVKEVPQVAAQKASSKDTVTKSIKKKPTKEQVAKKKQKEANAGSYDGELYTVGNGETLSIIAGKILGDTDRWEELYILNPHIVSPDIVYSGTILKVPKYSMVKKEARKWGNPDEKTPEPTETKNP